LFDAQRYEGDAEDERRLFYVAITRAKDALVITHFRKMNKSFKRSQFVDDMLLPTTTKLSDRKPLPKLQVSQTTPSEEIQTFSAGEIISFRACPYMYLLRDVWGFRGGLNQRIGYGNGLHYCLRRAGELIKNDGYSPISAIATAVDEGFHMPFMGGTAFDDLRTGARNTLLKFAEKFGKDLQKIEELEYRIEYPLQNATITGRVDVIMKDAANVEVRDYKTSDEARTSDEASLQVRLYSLGLRKNGWPVVGGSVAYLEDPRIEEIRTDNQSLADAEEKTSSAIRNIISRRYVPNPSSRCTMCDHKAICRWRT
jgi:DNA helicase-2/ATP-dependent DNA helicase PcrA